MARVGKVKRTERREDDGSHRLDVVVDPGGGANVTAPYYAPPGEDSPPLPGDYAALAEAPGRGEKSAVGFQDAKNAGKALDGEKRFYLRDEDGNELAEFYMSRTGLTIEVLDSGTLPITLKTAGAVTLDSPDVRLTDEAGKSIARVGDLVYVTVPLMVVTAVATSGSAPVIIPVLATNPAQQTLTGYIGAGQIVSGQPKAKA